MLLFIEVDLQFMPDRKDVSIHLMLLFIVYAIVQDFFCEMFQYISCYSLSIFMVIPPLICI